MSDHEAVVAVVRRQHLYADEGRWDELAALFTDPVEVDYADLTGEPGGPVAPAALVAGWRAVLGGFDATQHLLAREVVDVAGDAATCTADVQATHRLATAAGGSLWTLGARYAYRLRREPAGWRIAAVRLTVLWGDGNQQLPALAAARREPVEVVERFFAALEAMDVGAFVALWHDDGVQEMPFAPPGFPRRLEGKEAIRRQYGGLPDAYVSMRFPRRLRAAGDGLVVAEYGGEIALRSGGRYDNTYVGLFEVRDGRLRRFVECFDPQVLADAFGGDAATTFGFEDEPG